MTYIKQYGFFVVTIVLTLIGYLKLKSGVNDGIDAANTYLRSMGGSMDSAQFNAIQNMFVISNVILGGIVFAVGLSFLCFSIYKLLKEVN
ncbi:hypothetical protein ACUL41_06245 [Virgibacillus natechei]